MPYTARDRLDQVYLLAAIWLETLFYGFYVCLFMLAMYILVKPGAVRTSQKASQVFFAALLLMFLTATFHEMIAMYRLIRAYGYIIGPEGTPISYFHQVVGWDSYANIVLMGIMIWIGDALVIYRCYIIWGHNLRIIILPLLLFLATLCVNITLYIWYGHQFATFDKILPIVDASYPLMFAQNVITTGLIAWKIYKQHRRSKASGLAVSHRVSLINVVRIIVESALLYTFELMLLIILYYANHPSQFIIQAVVVPSIGIVFSLIAIRVHAARICPLSNGAVSSVIPPWLSDSDPAFQTGESSSGGVSGISSKDHCLEILGPRKDDNSVHTHLETSTDDPSRDKSNPIAV